jgi:hypothetical protein
VRVGEEDLEDNFRMGDNFYIRVLYEGEGVALDESSFSKAIYLELKADNVEEMRQKIVSFGVRVLEMQDPHLYFQAWADKSSAWSEPTRTSPNMRGPTTASCPKPSGPTRTARRRVDRLGRNRGQPQPGDAPASQKNSDFAQLSTSGYRSARFLRERGLISYAGST